MFKTRELRKIINLCTVHFDYKTGDIKCLWVRVQCCGLLPKIRLKPCRSFVGVPYNCVLRKPRFKNTLSYTGQSSLLCNQWQHTTPQVNNTESENYILAFANYSSEPQTFTPVNAE